MSARLLLLVFLAHAGVAMAADLGRLFFTPTQRATLDNARKQNIRVEIGNDGNEPQPQLPTAAAPVPQNMTVNGMVRRSDGKSTVWVNDHAVGESGAGGVKIVPGKAGDRVKVTAPDGSRSVDLKVGQTVEILSGTVEEGYARRSTLKPEPAPADKPAAAGAPAPKPQVAAAPPPRATDAKKQNEPAKPAPAETGPAK